MVKVREEGPKGPTYGEWSLDGTRCAGGGVCRRVRRCWKCVRREEK